MNTKKSFFEKLGGTYTQVGDVLLPNLTIGAKVMMDVLTDGMIKEI